MVDEIRKLDLIEEGLRVVEGLGDYPVADMVFAGERIEVGLKRGKFDYISSTSTNARRIGATGAKRKEGDTHAVTSVPAWVKPPQTSHGTHQYAQHHPSFSARAGDSSNSAPV